MISDYLIKYIDKLIMNILYIMIRLSYKYIIWLGFQISLIDNRISTLTRLLHCKIRTLTVNHKITSTVITQRKIFLWCFVNLILIFLLDIIRHGCRCPFCHLTSVIVDKSVILDTSVIVDTHYWWFKRCFKTEIFINLLWVYRWIHIDRMVWFFP